MKDELIMSVISGRSSSRHSLRRNIGMSMHDFDGADMIIFWISSCVDGANRVRCSATGSEDSSALRYNAQ